MKKYSQVVLSLAIRAAVLHIAYQYLYKGDSGSGNMLIFFLSLTSILSFAIAVIPDVRREMRSTGNPIPMWADAIYGYILTGALAYHGHFILASMAVLIHFSYAVIYGSNPKEAPNA